MDHFDQGTSFTTRSVFLVGLDRRVMEENVLDAVENNLSMRSVASSLKYPHTFKTSFSVKILIV